MKKILIGVVILSVAALLFSMTGRMISAQAGASDDMVSSKLDGIIKTQKAIAADIEAIRQDLAVIKIRVTQSQ